MGRHLRFYLADGSGWGVKKNANLEVESAEWVGADDTGARRGFDRKAVRVCHYDIHQAQV
jgi:hypothetical protein